MSFPRYPKYKPSGVEWLGEVPEHWSAGRLRHFARRYSGGTPDKTNLGYWQDGVIPWLNSGAVNDRLISEPSTFITAEAFANSSAKWVPTGALVMALAGQGKTKGMVAQLGIPSTCNQSMAAIVPNPNLDARFLFWWLDSNYQSIRNLAGGDLRDGLNLELVGDIPLPVVPLPEQTAIAEFLDRETGKIDGLVAEQRRLMELLKEKRQAVISHAVTKGLNPHAPMKPSGIEWLGDVPQAWGRSRLGFESWVRARLGWKGLKAEEYVKDGFAFLATPNLKATAIDFVDVNYITQERYEESPEIKLAVGDVLLVKDGATLGIVNLVRHLPRPTTVNGSIAVITPGKQLRSLFLYFLFTSSGFQQLIQRVKGGMGVPHLFQSDLNKFYLPIPPLTEQDAIVEFLEAELLKFDTLTAEAQRAIDLLQERRTALISAAVTGQIDVRQQPRN